MSPGDTAAVGRVLLTRVLDDGLLGDHEEQQEARRAEPGVMRGGGVTGGAIGAEAGPAMRSLQVL